MASRFTEFKNWCLNHPDLAIGGFCAGLGLVSTCVKFGSKIYTRHMDNKNRDLRIYDPSIGRYWILKRRLTNLDQLEIEQRKAIGEHLGQILDSMNVLR